MFGLSIVEGVVLFLLLATGYAMIFALVDRVCQAVEMRGFYKAICNIKPEDLEKLVKEMR